MTDVVIVQPIAPSGVDLLRRTGLDVFEAPSPDLAELRLHLATARAAITRNLGLSAEAMALAPKLRLIASHGTGTDRIDHAAAARRGIAVVNTPGTNAGAVAEHAIALIFACTRRIVAADCAVRAGAWEFRETALTWEVSGRTLGLVGYGHVAAELARRARGLGLTVIAATRHVRDADLARDGVARATDIDALLGAADIVSLHGRPGSAPVLTPARLAGMRPGAVLVNTARGALVDSVALAQALNDGRIAAAALDVFEEEPLPADSPLLAAPNLVLTPHIGGASPEALERTSRAVAGKVIAGLGLPLPDAPPVQAEAP